MKIWVGMIAYNAGPVITSAINSVVGYVDEIIVVDGSAYGPSTDHTALRAKEFGRRVRVIQGTFAKKDGSWDEQAQRQAYLDVMGRDSKDWCILQDADEVYDTENLLLLIGHLLTAQSETMLFSHGFVHFWRNLHQVMTGGAWDRSRDVCAFRLTPKMQTNGLVTVGEGQDDDLAHAEWPRKINLPHVHSYHYGHALPFERLSFKVQEYFKAGYFTDRKHQTLEQFMEEYKVNLYHKKNPNIIPYNGPQPEAILPLIGSYFK